MTTQTNPYRLSGRQAGQCVKALFLQLTGQPPSNPPDENVENRMDAGLAMKAVVAQALKRRDWELRDPEQFLTVRVAPNLEVATRPDHLGRHPNITDGHWVIVQTGSAKETSFKRWLKESSLRSASQRHRVHQLAILSSTYHQAPEPPEDLDLEQPQMIAMLNRDTGMLEYETIPPGQISTVAQAVHANLLNLSEALKTGETPEAPFDRNNSQCRQCEFLTMCHGKAPRGSADAVSQEQLDAAIAVIEELHEDVQAAKPAAGRYDRSRKVIREYMIQNKISDLELDGENNTWKAHMEWDAQVRVDAEAARAKLSKEVMDEISSTSHVMSFNAV